MIPVAYSIAAIVAVSVLFWPFQSHRPKPKWRGKCSYCGQECHWKCTECDCCGAARFALPPPVGGDFYDCD